MTDLAKEFADLHSENQESPWDFLYFSFLAYLGAIVSPHVTLESSLEIDTRLYVTLLGESGITRKSTSLRSADKFFRGLGAYKMLPGVGSAEGLTVAFNGKKNKKQVEVDASNKLVVVSAEDANWLEHPAPNGVVILHFDELKAFVSKGSIDSSVLLPMVNTLFERDEYGNATKSGVVHVAGARLVIVSACTMDTYSTMFSKPFLAIGFPNRLWLVPGATTKSFPIPVELPANDYEKLRDAVGARINQIEDAAAMGGRIKFPVTPGALEIFTQWYNARSGSEHETRLDTYGHRLALVYAVAQQKDVVDEDVMVQVVNRLKWQVQVRREHDPIDAENNTAKLEQKIRNVLGGGPLKFTDLKRKCHYTRWGTHFWNRAWTNLTAAQEVLVNKPSPGMVMLGPSAPNPAPVHFKMPIVGIST